MRGRSSSSASSTRMIGRLDIGPGGIKCPCCNSKTDRDEWRRIIKRRERQAWKRQAVKDASTTVLDRDR